jgi:hypothetical protein
VTLEWRRRIAFIVFILDVLVCPIWAYSAASFVLQSLSSAGSGGIGAVSVSGGIVESLFTIVPPIVLMAGLRVMMVSIAVFRPVQVFFVVGALAIWIASPRPPQSSPES